MYRLHFLPRVDLIRDPIYGFIELPEEIRGIVDAPEVQRLRWISQLPLEQMVYPSAQHSRFEHSLGVMYLSMIAAHTLLQDNLSKTRILNALKKSEEHFDMYKNSKEYKKIWKRLFVLSSGIVGLLHDVGHAPFSHTFEETLKDLPPDKFSSFNHEVLSYVIAKHVLKEYLLPEVPQKIWDIFRKDILSALNKRIRVNELQPIARILRTIVDGPIDTDKGDYLLRDSYHCGVNYGIYDLERLWRFVRIASDFTIGVHPKGALEAWTLRFSRYKMFKNVYWHHLRDITDALLMDALKIALKNEKKYSKICPLNLPVTESSTLTYQELFNLFFWTDTYLLNALKEYNEREIREILDWIHRRRLPKRLFKEPSTITIPVDLDINDRRKIRERIRDYLCSKIKEDHLRIWVIFHRVQPFPLLDPDTVRIRVIHTNGKEELLPEYLGFYDQLQRQGCHDIREGRPEFEDIETSYGTSIRIFVQEEHREKVKYIEVKDIVIHTVGEIESKNKK